MSENNQLFDMASLAEAAYANLSENGVTITASSDVKTSLLIAGWSDTQATEFLTHYRVVSQRPNTASGYSGTVFERLDDAGNPKEQFVFAQRGTEPALQFNSSAPLGLDIAVDIGDLSLKKRKKRGQARLKLSCYQKRSCSRIFCAGYRPIWLKIANISP